MTRHDVDPESRSAADRSRSAGARRLDAISKLGPEMDEHDLARIGPDPHVERLFGRQVAAPRIVELGALERRLRHDELCPAGGLDASLVRSAVAGDGDPRAVR